MMGIFFIFYHYNRIMETLHDKVYNYHGNKKNLVHTKKMSSYNRPVSKLLGSYITPVKRLGYYTGKSS
jgi:hypothetical protein